MKVFTCFNMFQYGQNIMLWTQFEPIPSCPSTSQSQVTNPIRCITELNQNNLKIYITELSQIALKICVTELSQNSLKICIIELSQNCLKNMYFWIKSKLP